MAVSLPVFKNTLCEMLTVSAHIQAPHGKLSDLFTGRKPIYGRYRPASRPAYFRALCYGPPANILHVDCALRTVFPENSRIPVTHKKRDVLDLIESFVGCSADVMVTGVFAVLMKQLPEHGLVRPLLDESKGEDTTIQLTQGTISLKGTPLSQIGWVLDPKGKKIGITIKGTRSTEIHSDYLNESLEWINRLFQFFVLMRSERASR